MTPIDFKGHGSKVKVTPKTLLLNLVNRINPFYIAIYNVIHPSGVFCNVGVPLVVFVAKNICV